MPRVAPAYLESRREQILDAALTCFARDGFHRTTMQDIVRETGLSAGAIYRYFPAKEDIIAAIAARRRTPDAAALERTRDERDAIAGLRQLVEASLRPLADPDEQRWRRVTVQVWAEALRDRRVMDVVRSGFDEPVELIAGLIRRAQRERRLPASIETDAAARVCASIFYGLVLQQAWDPDVDVDAYIGAVLAIIKSLADAATVKPRRPAPAPQATPRRASPRGS